ASFYSTASAIRTCRNFSERFSETRHLSELVSPASLNRPIIRPCGSSRLLPCQGDGWLAVGDAAFTMQPLASAGVAKAIRDARRVAEHIYRGSSNYERRQAEDLHSYSRQLVAHYELERRWVGAPFWAKSRRSTNDSLS